MRPSSDPLLSKRLYISDLAERLQAMEASTRPDAVAYKLFARRMQSAMAGYPEPLLAAQLGAVYPAVRHALAQRHFDAHGGFDGEAGVQARTAARRLLRRLSRG